MRKKVKNDIGKKFNRLTILNCFLKKGLLYHLCKCDCGTTCEIRRTRVISGRCKSCGCLQKETMSKSRLKPNNLAAKNQLYKVYIRAAKKRGIPFDLGFSTFIKITQEDCHYCGISPFRISKVHRSQSQILYNGIDRKNNDEPYTYTNCVPCCFRCNQAKSNIDYFDFLLWIQKVHKLHSYQIKE